MFFVNWQKSFYYKEALLHASFSFSSQCLTLVSTRLSKTIKTVFYFIEKALFVLKILNFLCFFPSIAHFQDRKVQMEVE